MTAEKRAERAEKHWRRASMGAKLAGQHGTYANRLAEEQYQLAMSVSSELRSLMQDRSPTEVYEGAKSVQRAWKTHKLRSKIDASIQGYDTLRADEDVDGIRKRNNMFRVVLAQEQEFLANVKLLQTEYNEPLADRAMPDTKMRPSYFVPRDHQCASFLFRRSLCAACVSSSYDG